MCDRLRHTGDHLRDGDILQRRELRQQVMELIDEADFLPAHRGAPGIVQLGRVLAANDHRPRIRLFQQPGQMQQG